MEQLPYGRFKPVILMEDKSLPPPIQTSLTHLAPRKYFTLYFRFTHLLCGLYEAAVYQTQSQQTRNYEQQKFNHQLKLVL